MRTYFNHFFLNGKELVALFWKGKTPHRRIVSHQIRQMMSNVTLQTLTQVLKEYLTKFGEPFRAL